VVRLGAAVGAWLGSHEIHRARCAPILRTARSAVLRFKDGFTVVPGSSPSPPRM
jgi:hypothetical protein